MREWEDTKKLEERNKMSLKEWKNNELNQLLMKKFGILKEQKDIKMVDKDEVPEGAEVVVPDGPGDLVGIKKEEQELNEEEVEEGRKSASHTNKDKFVGHEDKYQNVREEKEIEEASCGKKKYMEEIDLNEEEVEEGRKSARATDKDRFVGHEDRYQNVREELDAIANLQETVRKIKEAKKVFFKGKRIK